MARPKRSSLRASRSPSQQAYLSLGVQAVRDQAGPRVVRSQLSGDTPRPANTQASRRRRSSNFGEVADPNHLPGQRRCLRDPRSRIGALPAVERHRLVADPCDRHPAAPARTRGILECAPPDGGGRFAARLVGCRARPRRDAVERRIHIFQGRKEPPRGGRRPHYLIQRVDGPLRAKPSIRRMRSSRSPAARCRGRCRPPHASGRSERRDQGRVRRPLRFDIPSRSGRRGAAWQLVPFELLSSFARSPADFR